MFFEIVVVFIVEVVELFMVVKVDVIEVVFLEMVIVGVVVVAF